MEDIRKENLAHALRLGLIDWYQFFEEWRKLP